MAMDFSIDKGFAELDQAVAMASASRLVRMPCDGCAYKEEGVETDLIFEFNFPARDHTKVSLNGVLLFPVEIPDDAPLVATQMPRDVSSLVYAVDKSSFPEVELYYTRIIVQNLPTPEGDIFYTLELNVFAVDHRPVKLDGFRMAIIQQADGVFVFGPVEAIPKVQTCSPNIRCLLAKMMDKIRNAKFPKFRGCGRKAGHKNPVVQGLAGKEDVHKDRHMFKGHHGQRHGHPSVFNRIIGQVLLPIFIGILAGLTVSLIGLVIGHGFVMLFRRLKAAKREGRRGGCFGRRRRERRERKERERLVKQQADGDAEKGLLHNEEEGEAPPAYVEGGLEVVQNE